MRALSIGLALVSMVSVATADATHAKGDKASGLARALKFAGVKPTTAKTARTYTAANITCTTAKEPTQDEQLGDYACSVDKLTVRDATAFVLQTALETAGAVGQDGMMKHKTVVIVVKCIIDPSKPADDRFDCQLAPGGM